MLEDINKIIPKLDEEDSSKMYENIVRRSEKKKISLFSKKLVFAFSSFAVVLAMIPIIIILSTKNNPIIERNQTGENNLIDVDSNSNKTGNNQDNGNNPIPDDNYNDNYDYTNVTVNKDFVISNNQVIGLAAFSVFDKNESIKLTSNEIDETTDEVVEKENLETSNGYVKVSYPFDYVIIRNATKFDVTINDINDPLAKEIIMTYCGLGKLEVVMADFSAYVVRDGVWHNLIDDQLITIRGYNGIYTILLNGAHYDYGTNYYCYSSHKKITSDAITKDKTPPILTIIVKENNNDRYIYFKSAETVLDWTSYNQKYAFKNEESIEKFDDEKLCSILELTELENKKVVGTIKSIDNETFCIEVETDENLRFVYVNQTQTAGDWKQICVDEDQKIYIKIKYEVGDKILVEYCTLFGNYNPVEVLATYVSYVS